MQANEIVVKAGMSSHPEYYSGCGKRKELKRVEHLFYKVFPELRPVKRMKKQDTGEQQV